MANNIYSIIDFSYLRSKVAKILFWNRIKNSHRKKHLLNQPNKNSKPRHILEFQIIARFDLDDPNNIPSWCKTTLESLKHKVLRDGEYEQKISCERLNGKRVCAASEANLQVRQAIDMVHTIGSLR